VSRDRTKLNCVMFPLRFTRFWPVGMHVYFFPMIFLCNYAYNPGPRMCLALPAVHGPRMPTHMREGNLVDACLPACSTYGTTLRDYRIESGPVVVAYVACTHM